MSGRALSGSAVLTGGQIVAQLCGFLRNIIVARIMTPADFGVAAALATSVSLVELFSDMGHCRYLTRMETTNDIDLLGASHVLTLLRGVVAATALWLLAPLIAELFQMSAHTWAFETISSVVLLRALAHNDVWLMQRELRFNGLFLVTVVPQAVTIALAYPVANALRDFSAVLWLLVINTTATLTMSHLVARCRYRLAFNAEYMGKMWNFGWPLLLNGIMLFAVFHGERVVVGNCFGDGVLGRYSAAFLLVSMPTMALSQITMAVLVPILAHSVTNRNELTQRYGASASIMVLASVLLMVPFAVGGDLIVRVVFGEAYTVSALLFALLATGQALQMARATPICASMALGDTAGVAIASSLRMASVCVAWMAAAAYSSLITVVAVSVAGECAATIFIAHRVRCRYQCSLGWWPVQGTCCIVLAAYLIGWVVRASGAGWIVSAGVALGSGVISGAVVVWCIRDLRVLLWSIVCDTGGIDHTSATPELHA